MLAFRPKERQQSESRDESPKMRPAHNGMSGRWVGTLVALNTNDSVCFKVGVCEPERNFVARDGLMKQ